MITYNRGKTNKTYIPGLLDPPDVKNILDALNINYSSRFDLKQNGWVKIKSPFREDKNPSFSINVGIGCFKDFAFPDVKGDIVDLVMLSKKCSLRKAEDWIIDTANLNLK